MTGAPFISAADLAATRSLFVGTALFTPAQITRAGQTVVASVGCTVVGDRSELHLPWMPAGQVLRRWSLHFPVGTDVQVADRIVVTGDGTYAVASVETPRDWEPSARVYAYRLYDAAGNPVYFTANATITLSRFIKDTGTKKSTLTPIMAGVSALIDDIGVRLKLQGIAPEFDLILVCDGAIDVHDGDRVTGYVSAATVRDQVFQVQHVDHNQALGWDYKLASMTAVS